MSALQQCLQDPERVLRNIMRIIEARSSEVVEKWIGFFGEASYLLLTHTVTHTGKRADGTNGRKSAGEHDVPDKRGHKRPGKQQTSPSQSVGKDEVPVQIWVAAPQNTRFPGEKRVFSLLFATILMVRISAFAFDHITSHRQKKTGLRGHFAFE